MCVFKVGLVESTVCSDLFSSTTGIRLAFICIASTFFAEIKVSSLALRGQLTQILTLFEVCLYDNCVLAFLGKTVAYTAQYFAFPENKSVSGKEVDLRNNVE